MITFPEFVFVYYQLIIRDTGITHIQNQVYLYITSMGELKLKNDINSMKLLLIYIINNDINGKKIMIMIW